MASTLKELKRAADDRAKLSRQVTRLCGQAREAGHTWSEIADAAGMTPPGARKAALRYLEGR